MAFNRPVLQTCKTSIAFCFCLTPYCNMVARATDNLSTIYANVKCIALTATILTLFKPNTKRAACGCLRNRGCRANCGLSVGCHWARTFPACSSPSSFSCLLAGDAVGAERPRWILKAFSPPIPNAKGKLGRAQASQLSERCVTLSWITRNMQCTIYE